MAGALTRTLVHIQSGRLIYTKGCYPAGIESRIAFCNPLSNGETFANVWRVIIREAKQALRGNEGELETK